MIKLVTFQKRAEGLTRPEFEWRWRTIHGPIAARFPGLVGYMLGFSLEPGEPPADGVAQLWFASRESCQQSYASEIGRNGSADAIKYLARREHLLASEQWRSGRGALASTPFKLVISAKRKAGQSRAEFLRWWPDVLPELGPSTGAQHVRVAVDDAGLLLNSKTTGVLGLVVGEAVHDGMLELWYPDRPSLEAAAGLARDQAAALRDDVARLEISCLAEHVVVRPPAPAYGQEETST